MKDNSILKNNAGTMKAGSASSGGNLKKSMGGKKSAGGNSTKALKNVSKRGGK